MLFFPYLICFGYEMDEFVLDTAYRTLVASQDRKSW